MEPRGKHRHIAVEEDIKEDTSYDVLKKVPHREN